MEQPSWIDRYINSHPRESLKIVLIGSSLIWQTLPLLLGIGAYYLLRRWLQLPIVLLLVIGADARDAEDEYGHDGRKTDPKSFHHVLLGQPCAARRCGRLGLYPGGGSAGVWITL